MPPINFFSEDTDFSAKNKSKISSWLSWVISSENHILKELNYIFCSDNYLVQINKQYLNLDDYTDIITFDNSEREDEVEGDVFISIDRVIENKYKFGTGFDKELHRVIVHGVLHLMGYQDKSEEDIRLMREKEDYYLNQVTF